MLGRDSGRKYIYIWVVNRFGILVGVTHLVKGIKDSNPFLVRNDIYLQGFRYNVKTTYYQYLDVRQSLLQTAVSWFCRYIYPFWPVRALARGSLRVLHCHHYAWPVESHSLRNTLLLLLSDMPVHPHDDSGAKEEVYHHLPRKDYPRARRELKERRSRFGHGEEGVSG